MKTITILTFALCLIAFTSNAQSADSRIGRTPKADSFEAAPEVMSLDLVNFDADLIYDKVELNWATATEQNTAYFEIQSCTDDGKFETVEYVEAAGKSNDLKVYRIANLPAHNGNTYYRLKQVKRDGEFCYSGIVKIELNSAPVASMKLFPNPAQGQVKINFDGKTPERINVIAVNGQVLKSITPENDSEGLLIDIAELEVGLYFVEMQTGVQRTAERLLVK